MEYLTALRDLYPGALLGLALILVAFLVRDHEVGWLPEADWFAKSGFLLLAAMLAAPAVL